MPDAENDVTVVVATNGGDEFVGGDQVFLTDKKTK